MSISNFTLGNFMSRNAIEKEILKSQIVVHEPVAAWDVDLVLAAHELAQDPGNIHLQVAVTDQLKLRELTDARDKALRKAVLPEALFLLMIISNYLRIYNH